MKRHVAGTSNKDLDAGKTEWHYLNTAAVCYGDIPPERYKLTRRVVSVHHVLATFLVYTHVVTLSWFYTSMHWTNDEWVGKGLYQRVHRVFFPSVDLSFCEAKTCFHTTKLCRKGERRYQKFTVSHEVNC